MNARKRITATLAMLAAAATLSLTMAGTASAVEADVNVSSEFLIPLDVKVLAVV